MTTSPFISSFIFKESLRSEEVGFVSFSASFQKASCKANQHKDSEIRINLNIFLKSQFAPGFVCMHKAAFKFLVPFKPFRENHGTSWALALVCSQIARVWQMAEVGPTHGCIDLNLSLVLPQPPAKLCATWWSGSELSGIQTVKVSTFRKSVKRDFFGFSWKKPYFQETNNHSTHCDFISSLRKIF